MERGKQGSLFDCSLIYRDSKDFYVYVARDMEDYSLE
jgi:hypothetical protein